MNLRTLVVPALVASLAFSACGANDGTSSDTTLAAAPPVTTGDEAGFNDADVLFVQGMIPHHEQAIEMAELAIDPTARAGSAVVDVATRVRAGQDPEIELMKTWLALTGAPAMEDMADHDMDSMEGMMSAEDMSRLSGLQGAAFDEAWLTMMIAHHEGAVVMAEQVLQTGQQPDVAALAERVIAAQRAEITEMKALLDR